MLEAEAVLLLLARRRIQQVAAGRADIYTAAVELRDSLLFTFVAGRRNSRAIAATETEAELVVLRDAVGAPPAQPGRGIYRTAAQAESEDLWRGQRAARGYANHWVADAERLGADGATAAQDWRVKMAADTEASQAFTAEREAILQDFADREPDLAAQLVKVWDATMDKLTCPTCREAHGTIVGINEPFPNGEQPGGVHPRCNCTEQILTAYEAGVADEYIGFGADPRIGAA